VLKKLIYLSIIILPYFVNSQGDKGFYVYGQAGYKFGSVLTSFVEDKMIENNQISNSYQRVGGGNTITGAFGKMMHPNFGMELSGTYTIGNNKLISNYNPNYSEFNKEIRSKNFHFVGSLVVQTNIFSKLKLYAKAGVVVSVLNQSNIYTSYMSSGTKNEYEYLNKGEIMKGLNGSLGILYPLGKKTYLMLEAEEVSVQGGFRSADLSLNRSNQNLASEVFFLDNTKGLNTSQYERKYPISYSCIGLNIGILHSF
jgi:hypothetical protein